MITVADASALYAAFDAAQPEHRDALDIVDRGVLAISPLVVTELDHLAHRDLGFPAAVQVSEALNARSGWSVQAGRAEARGPHRCPRGADEV